MKREELPHRIAGEALRHPAYVQHLGHHEEHDQTAISIHRGDAGWSGDVDWDGVFHGFVGPVSTGRLCWLAAKYRVGMTRPFGLIAA